MTIPNKITDEAAIAAEVQRLLELPYKMVIRGTRAEGYLGEAPELPGCLTAGETPTEAMEMLRDAMAAWLSTALADGLPIPQPETTIASNGSNVSERRLP